jgi:hypothetical protein
MSEKRGRGIAVENTRIQNKKSESSKKRRQDHGKPYP